MKLLLAEGEMLVKWFYQLAGRRNIPYYAHYPVWLILWKPIRKFINVVFIPNISINWIRVSLYRLLGYEIGRNVFIGMKCYLDDMEPCKTVIEDDVTISYGCYFSVHGRGQGHTTIRIKHGAYIGMRCTILSGKSGITIGEECLIGAGSVVNRSIPDGMVAVGVPARVIKERKRR